LSWDAVEELIVVLNWFYEVFLSIQTKVNHLFLPLFLCQIKDLITAVQQHAANTFLLVCSI